MKLKELGKSSSKAEVTQISTHGIWLLAKGVEYFLPFHEFPWFEKATVVQIHNVQLLHGFHLRWPDLDVDLHIESLNDLEKYPLVANYSHFETTSAKFSNMAGGKGIALNDLLKGLKRIRQKSS